MSDEPLVLHRGVGMPTRCRSCKKVIVFAVMPASGKSAPFEEDVDGAWVLENGTARHVGTGGRQLELGAKPLTYYTSHFAKCVDAAKWRAKDR